MKIFNEKKKEVIVSSPGVTSGSPPVNKSLQSQTGVFVDQDFRVGSQSSTVVKSASVKVEMNECWSLLLFESAGLL